MTSYFSILFFAVFLPLVVAAYGIAPRKARWVVLLVASYAFFWILSGRLIVFILASTASVYGLALALDAQIRQRDERLANATSGKRAIRANAKRRMRAILSAGVLLNVGMLVALKYVRFFGEALSDLLGLFGHGFVVSVPPHDLPIGISFYTLMAVSYLVDVYRESVRADRNLGRVALYLSFFPQIMEGPICRYNQTAESLTAGDPLDRRSMYAGTVRILYGFAKKIIVADRLNAFVRPVFGGHYLFDGGVTAFAAILYTLQLYCDFSGTMDVALGIGQIFNVRLPRNFRQPFFSRTASEFWKRWHITLGTWLKDYVYYPVSLSAPCKRLTKRARKVFGNRYGPLLASSVALLCVWVINGLWHGAGSQYLFFGMYYFVLIMSGGLIEPVAAKAGLRLHVDRTSAPYRAFQTVRTLVIVFVGEMFFRANGLAAGLAMFRRIVTDFSLGAFTSGAIFAVGLDGPDYLVVCLTLAGVLAVGIAQERGRDVLGALCERGTIARWAVAIALFMAIVIFGAYGASYIPIAPMYAKF